MDATGRNNPAKNSDSSLKTSTWGTLIENGLLKTTTWGALMALSLLAAAFGFRGSLFGSRTDSTGQIESRLESPQLSLTQGHVQVALKSTDSGQKSRLKGPALDQRGTSGVPSVYRQVPPSRSSAFPTGTTTPGAPNQSLNDAADAASDNQNPQTLIAAKIAADLKGIDPDKPVDVIVQFRHAPSDTELDADGAVTKSELPLLKARLVTMRGADVANLATHSNVVYVSPDRKVSGALDHVVTAVNADLAHASGWDGTGIGVAIIDRAFTI